ncbi:murein biosynthesis integral membrane protein MurJ [Fusobacterium polymorphum]|jgi:integral membrane protein mviN|uniref:murein biosynthesis integral membrane protein MurJ n=1 Tax=Fusobacterium nucleatum subsp. polymorphum TaxID=76857 RepID=UPI001C6E7C09|nr:murein biosynthesis integral membrane protein MurJ [Fusobacterium polymorphum]QYR61471.1 murein biosynthesis integral membrane protein MurJ [Fusobacterium polymorphum]
MKKIIIVVMIFNLMSKLFAFFRELSLAYFFGASSLTDAYIVAFSIPTIIFGIIGSGIINGYIPIYNQIKENSNETSAKQFTANFTNIMLLICFFVFIIGFFFSTPLVKIFSYGFNEETLHLASFFTKISLLSIFPIMLVSIFSGYLQLNNKFFAVAFIGIPTNLLYILGTYIAYKNNNFILLIFFTCFALLFQFIFLCPFIFKTGFKYKFKINIYDKNLQQLLMLSIPIILGTSLEQINILIDRTVASSLGAGAISILNYSGKLNGAILSLSIVAVLNILFPKFSSLVSENNIDELKEQVKYIINMIFIFAFPIMFGIITLNQEATLFIFGRGNLDENAILSIARSLSFYSLCFVALCIRDLSTKIFYSFKNSKTPVINSSIGIILNIILNLILSRYLGVSGIALATSISTIFISILLFYNLKRYNIYLDKSNFILLFKVILASLFMIFIIYISKRYLSLFGNFNIVIYIINALISYILMIFILKVNEIRDLFKLFFKVLKLGKK